MRETPATRQQQISCFFPHLSKACLGKKRSYIYQHTCELAEAVGSAPARRSSSAAGTLGSPCSTPVRAEPTAPHRTPPPPRCRRSAHTFQTRNLSHPERTATPPSHPPFLSQARRSQRHAASHAGRRSPSDRTQAPAAGYPAGGHGDSPRRLRGLG